MSLIAISSASFCGGEEVSAATARRLGYGLLTTTGLLEETSRRSGLPVEKVVKSLGGHRALIGWLNTERERAVAVFRRVLAEKIGEDGLVVEGAGTHVLPASLSHVLRVGLAAPLDHRVEKCMATLGVDRGDAEDRIKADDEELYSLTRHLRGTTPWARGLFDIFLPMDSTSVDEAVDIICEGVAAPALRVGAAARESVRDFLLAANVALALAEEGKGRGLDVTANAGEVLVTINRYVMWLEKFERDVTRIASKVEGVSQVRTTIGPDFKRPDIYPGLDLEAPAKILLVDDEVEFVQTLSERLQTRNLNSAIAYDGPQALAMAEADEPEVILLDVKMPGMDGLEVLETLRKKHPRIRVIMLTAHGSEEGAKRARELGAYAYLRKPANIDELARLMNEACHEARGSGQAGEAESPAPPTDGDAGEEAEQAEEGEANREDGR